MFFEKNNAIYDLFIFGSRRSRGPRSWWLACSFVLYANWERAHPQFVLSLDESIASQSPTLLELTRKEDILLQTLDLSLLLLEVRS